jgi:hypothetical protein
MHGAAQLMDAIQQVQGRAGARQIPGARVARPSEQPRLDK